MSILDKIPNPKEQLKKGFDSIKGLLTVLAILGAAILGYAVGTRAFETGNLSELKNANITLSGVCKFSASGEERYPALLDDEVKVNAVEGSNLLVVVRKTREDLICDTNKVSYTALPLLSKWSTAPIQAPELTTAAPQKRQDPFWKQFEKRTMVVSGTCTNSKGDTLPNLIDEKVEVVSTSPTQEEGQFTLSGLKRSDRQSIICSSKLITYKVYDPSMEPREVVKEEVPVDFTGRTVLINSLCLPDKKYLKDRPVDPKTKKPIGKIPKTYNLLNSPVQIVSYKQDESGKVTYLEGKIVDQSSTVYGHKIICDPSVTKEALVIDYALDKSNSVINQKGEDVDTRRNSKLEVIEEGEDTPVTAPKAQPEPVAPAEPKPIDDNQRLQDLLKEIER